MRIHLPTLRSVLSAVVVASGGIAQANPLGGTVSQGSASFSSSGPRLTITTSAQAFINWQSFNIAPGETTTFVQPSTTSVVWNRINDPNPSQLLGTLNANGYVVLQNQNGFFIGGQAVLNAQGLLMTTAPTPAPDLSAGGPWSFNLPPPSAKIINYGQINIGAGGSAFLIADDIQNHGSISAPSGNIGLYAGQSVLVSTRPDGRGLSASVTLPQGSVDNSGRLIADGGAIALQAQVVNQGGLVQANTAANVNGTIEFLASDAVNLGAGSVVSAHGNDQGISSGGSVTIKSGNTFSDTADSTINVAGGAQGGNGGRLEISAANLGGFQSSLNAHASGGFLGGSLTIDPTTITLNAAQESTYNNQITSSGVSSFTVSADSILLTSSWTPPATLSELNLQANNTITVSALWTLPDRATASLLNLTAGNDIIFNTTSGIKAGTDWGLNLSAGPVDLASKPVTSRTDGIYLDGTSYIQTQNGDVNLFAANELLLGSGAIRTLAKGNIGVQTLVGNVNTGTGTAGFNYYGTAPYYTPFIVSITGVVQPTSSLGGISTAGGGNVTINAGGDVTSFFANSGSTRAVAIADPGTGAFGSLPGNVTITAGGSVYGHYVVANGSGSITAGQNIGTSGQNVSLSLIKGTWNLDAPNGNIYLQEVRNPNGVFDQPTSSTSPAFHSFDYDYQAAVDLSAGIGVYLTGSSLPRPVGAVPIIYPPGLNITAGLGGVNLLSSLILFPSKSPSPDMLPAQNLVITTTGNLEGNGWTLSMSDASPTHQWTSSNGAFTPNDVGSTPLQLNNPNAVVVDVSGNMNNFSLLASKETHITVGGDMTGCNFAGQNLHADDDSYIHVTGQIFNRLAFNSVFLSQSIPKLPLADLPPNTPNDWKAVLRVAVNSSLIASATIPPGTSPSLYYQYLAPALLFYNVVDNFHYNQKTGRLTYLGDMNLPLSSGSSTTAADALSGPLTVVRYDSHGNPEVTTGADGKLHFVTDTITWVDPSKIASLAAESLGAPSLSSSTGGYSIGGPGTFDVTASSMSLGNTLGILSYGVGSGHAYLAPYMASGGASITITVDGDLNMPASAIAALGGGSVTVKSTGGSMDLGSQDLLDVEQLIVDARAMALGIYTSGRGNVNVTALGDIDVDSSRIAAFNGGTINVLSEQGSVNAGLGGLNIVPVTYYYVNPKTGLAAYFQEPVYANGIVAETLMNSSIPGSARKPGNITIQTPQGDILAGAGGILQEALSGNVAAAGPVINLIAGTPPSADSAGFVGNISLGNSGVIGGTVNATASGNISGLVISRQDSTINAAASFSGTVLSGGTAGVSAGGTVSGTIIGVSGANVSGASGVSALVLSQNANVGGQAQNTLGATATATTASQSAAQQANNDTKQVASTTSYNADDDDKKKSKKPLLKKKISRVTVIFPSKS